MTSPQIYRPMRPLRSKLTGGDRMLDFLIGLVIVVASLVIALLAVTGLLAYGTELDTDAAVGGFILAVAGSAIPLFITTLVFIVRAAIGRRSWVAPLWGIGIAAVFLLIGYAIMLGSAPA